MKEKILALLNTIKQCYSTKVHPRLCPIVASLSVWHRRALAIALLIIIIGLLLPGPTPKPDVTLHHIDPPAMLTEESDSQGVWHRYSVAEGETLAQLFRDHGLPTESLYAMVSVQGNDKPLSTLSAGQQVKIRMTLQGDVTGLTLENTQGQVLFVRQKDGRFLRVQ
ncbi:LysM-like peptidoglycan-binding domain-containing protein [Rosenbergiella australiborealis]|nr:LysM-like peptidoglycan-binding domain-containing protein [Rosenbergiella australiborealis]